MNPTVAAIAAIIGRVMIATIFLMSTVGNKIPQFGSVVEYMEAKGVPAPSFLLVGAIVFLLAGSISVILGYKARIGAALLLVFLLLATYYFHDFWNLEGEAQQQEMIQFMKNLSMIGTMILIMAAGSGPGSLDNRVKATPKVAE